MRARCAAVSTGSSTRRNEYTLLDVTIGGLAAQPTVASVIAGATTAEQVQANACAARWFFLAGDFAGLDAITM